MKAQVDVICCKSVGTDLSMLDIEDFITEICQLKKEVASLEAKLRERGDKLNREDHESTDQTSDCNAGEQQMLQTPLKMCSVKLVDCRNLIEETTAEEQQQTDEEEQDDDEDLISPGLAQIFKRYLGTWWQMMMLSMEAQVDVICCKSVGTDLSMLDIEDFITEICQLKKEVASLEAKLRERGDKLNREV
ncbi:zinc finger 2-like protein [Labeo rohita]|uniref:Zinc finger 2-like protein n=1 Tax=Labeo rohita TaxID=84645 RepID=A0A498M327_LABRO|nr:zinc finger 2-like protein [Labeo rohita]RXN39341.1 zinc finger 2-like protein [Labeo rohita]